MSENFKTYKTSQGDMWDSIAYKLYGNEKHMKELIAANWSYIGYSVFPAGVALNIPTIDTTTAGDTGFPAWKK